MNDTSDSSQASRGFVPTTLVVAQNRKLASLVGFVKQNNLIPFLD